jgi:hypothetical protein
MLSAGFQDRLMRYDGDSAALPLEFGLQAVNELIGMIDGNSSHGPRGADKSPDPFDAG